MWLVKGIRNAELPQLPGNVLLTAGSVAIALMVSSPMSRSRRAIALLVSSPVSRSRRAIAPISLGPLLVIAFSVPAHTVGYLGLEWVWCQCCHSCVKP